MIKNTPKIWLVFSSVLVIGLSLLLSRPKPAIAVPDQTWPTISLSKLTGGLNSPVYITHAGDNSGRLFVVEQSGKIRVLINGALQTTPFLDIIGQDHIGRCKKFQHAAVCDPTR